VICKQATRSQTLFFFPRQAARAALGLLEDFIYARQAVEILELLLLSFTMSRDVPE